VDNFPLAFERVSAHGVPSQAGQSPNETLTAGGGLADPSSRTHLHVSLVAGLIGMAVAWLLPVSPGRWLGFVVLVVAVVYGVSAYFHALGPTFIYVRPQPFGGMALDGYRYYWIRHRGRRPLVDFRISLLDQCRAAAPVPEPLNAHFEFPQIGSTRLRGSERQVRWKPLSLEYEASLDHDRVAGRHAAGRALDQRVEFRLTVDRMKRGRTVPKRLIAIKSHRYVVAERPCGAPPEEAEGRQLRLAGVSGVPRLRSLGG
jgi:hypothetical protein